MTRVLGDEEQNMDIYDAEMEFPVKKEIEKPTKKMFKAEKSEVPVETKESNLQQDTLGIIANLINKETATPEMKILQGISLIAYNQQIILNILTKLVKNTEDIGRMIQNELDK